MLSRDRFHTRLRVMAGTVGYGPTDCILNVLYGQDASRTVEGKPVGGSMRWQLDTLDVLKAFAACVFRSSTFRDDDMRNGICEIVVQMVIHEVGLTHNTVDMLRTFIQGIRSNHAEEQRRQIPVK